MASFIFFSCKPGKPDAPLETTADSAGTTDRAPRTVERYAFLTSDYLGVPVPLLLQPEDSKAPFEVTRLEDGIIERIRKLDSEDRELERWDFARDDQKRMTELLHLDPHQTVLGRLHFDTMDPKVCVTAFGRMGREVERSCFTTTAPGRVEQTLMTPFGITASRRRLEVGDDGLVRRQVTYSRHGQLMQVELQQVNVTTGLVFMQYQRMGPQGALDSWDESRFDHLGRLVQLDQKYADGTTKSSTTYKYSSPFAARGRALTVEGMELNLDVRLNRFGQRILERKMDGSRLIEEEHSEYDDDGRLQHRRILDENQVVKHQERWVRNAAGLVTEYERYRGNLHVFECVGDEPDQRVSTKLPAFEKALMQYDGLGRVTRMERFYMHQPVDVENVRYGRNNTVTSREVRISDEPEPLRTEYEYDSMGNLTRTIMSRGQERTEVLEYEYNAAGQLVRQKLLRGDDVPPTAEEWPDGSVVQYFYDSQGRMIEERWSHADGQPALSTRSSACASCAGTDRRNAISRITWRYNNAGLLLQKQDFGDKGEVVHDSSHTYDDKGRQILHEVKWPRERKITRLATEYASGGWIQSTDFSTEINGKEVSRETRRFERAHLVRVERLRNGKSERLVERRYEKGRLMERRVTTPKEGTVIVTLVRNAAGLVVEENSVDGKGKPAVAQDAFENQYTQLVSTYNDRNQILSAVMIHEPKKTITRSEFSYDEQGRPTGRKVFVNQNLSLEIDERFDHPFLGPWGIATSQVRAVVSGKDQREVTSYQLFIDTADLKRSRATLTLPHAGTLELTNCRCTNCGLTVTMNDFNE